MAEKESLPFNRKGSPCSVCGDTAYKLYYGVKSCKHCKRFFKSSVIQNSEYEPCKNNQKCFMQGNNIYRCQSCHFKKCIDVGMSKDGVQCKLESRNEKTNALRHGIDIHRLEKSDNLDIQKDVDTPKQRKNTDGSLHKEKEPKRESPKIQASMKEKKKPKMVPELSNKKREPKCEKPISASKKEIREPKRENPIIGTSKEMKKPKTIPALMKKKIVSKCEKPKFTSTKKVKESKCEMGRILAQMKDVNFARPTDPAMIKKVEMINCNWNEILSAEKNSTTSTNRNIVNQPKREERNTFETSKNLNASNKKKQHNVGSHDEKYLTEIEELNLKFSLADVYRNTSYRMPCEKVAACFEKIQIKSTSSSSQRNHLLIDHTYSRKRKCTYCKRDIVERYGPAVLGVIELTKRIMTYFKTVCKRDRDILSKAAVFEILLVRLANLFNSQDDSICPNFKFISSDSVKEEFLWISMNNFAYRMNNLHLSFSELGIFCSIVLLASDHPELKNTLTVLKVQNELIGLLKRTVLENHPKNPNTFKDLMEMIPLLRILNCLHSKKHVDVYETEDGEIKRYKISEIIEIIADTYISVTEDKRRRK